MIKALASLDLGTAHIDVGRIAVGYEIRGASPEGLSVKKYVKQQVADLIGSNAKPIDKPRDVVLYGFGRIGRLMARLLVEKTDGGDTLRLRAVVVRKGKAANDLVKRASAAAPRLRARPLRRHHPGGRGAQSFVANGNEVKVIYADAPDDHRLHRVRHRRRHHHRQHRHVARRGRPVRHLQSQGRQQGDPDRPGQGRHEEHRRRHQSR